MAIQHLLPGAAKQRNVTASKRERPWLSFRSRCTLGAINSDHQFTEAKDRNRRREVMSNFFINSRRKFLGRGVITGGALLLTACSKTQQTAGREESKSMKNE